MAPVLRHCPCLRPENDDVKVLDYSHSNLDDVPNEVFSFERTLEELYLEANQIKDLPRPLFHCHGLRKLNLSDNEVNGLPPAVASLINLEQLDISKNGVIEIPDSIKGCKCLSMVDASVNPLGKLPEGFTQLINLQELYLNDTFLEYLPANFGRLSRLRILELRENHLKVLPKSMARLTELSRLDIGQNDFSDLPEVIGNLPRLVELWCDNNNLNCLPPFLGGLKKLSYLDASKNRIYEVAEEIEGCTSLCDLTLSSNRIKELPEGLSNLRKMTVLRVDLNRLIGLPMNIGNLIYMEELVLSSNDLSRLPYTIGLLRNLKTLIADDNLLEELPCEMGSCQRLSILSLRDNKLLHIPDELGHIVALKVINLSGNLLQYLPFSIAKLPNLQALWLSENQNKPLIPLQSDTDRATCQKVLTCFMLPQVPLEEEGVNVIEGKEVEEINNEGKGRQLIKFAFDLEKDQPSKLVRAPTPYPKELKAHARHARNYALKKQGFKESDVIDMSANNTRVAHNGMEALRCKGAPPDIMVMPGGPTADAQAKVKEAVVANSKSPPASPSHPKRDLQSDPKVNTQSSVESSGSDGPAKSLGRRDSRGDGSSSENTSSSPVGSPKTAGHGQPLEQASSTLDSRYRKNSSAAGGKKDTWMRQRLVRQGSGDSDRGYRSDHEVYLVERDQYGVYGTHSDGYASDWEAFLAKQNYAGGVPMMHQYGRPPGSVPVGYRGSAEGQEIQGDLDGTYWPGFQYAENQEEHRIGEPYPEMVMNQQGYWQADPNYAQHYQNYETTQQFQPTVSENPAYYYNRNEVPLQPAEFYQPPTYPSPPPQQAQQQPQQPPLQMWTTRPPGVIGSRTLPRRLSSSSPRPKRSQCISVQAPLHGTPQEYHLMPQGHPNLRPVSPGNSPRPGRSPSPRMENKFTYPPVQRMPAQNPYQQLPYPGCPVTSQPMNTVQFPTPMTHNPYYPAYHEAPPAYGPIPVSPRMKHMPQPYASAEDPMPQGKSFDNMPGIHSSSYYSGRMTQSDHSEHLVESLKHFPVDARNSVVGHEQYAHGDPTGFGTLQYRTASIPMQMQNLEYIADDISPMSHLNRSVPCINIIPSTSPPQSAYMMDDSWKENNENCSTDPRAMPPENANQIMKDSARDGTPVSPNAATARGESQESSQMPSQNNEGKVQNLVQQFTVAAESKRDEAGAINAEKSVIAQNAGTSHVQGVFKAMPLRSTAKTVQPQDMANSEKQTTGMDGYSSVRTSMISTIGSESKKSSDYENLEALQYHDYQNLPPISTSSSMMKNFRKECSEIKKEMVSSQSMARPDANNYSTYDNTASGNHVVNGVNPDCSKTASQLITNKAVDTGENVKAVVTEKIVNHQATAVQKQIDAPVAMIQSKNKWEQTNPETSGNNPNGSTNSSKGSYAISSLDTVVGSQTKSSTKSAKPNTTKVHQYTSQPEVHCSMLVKGNRNSEQVANRPPTIQGQISNRPAYSSSADRQPAPLDNISKNPQVTGVDPDKRNYCNPAQVADAESHQNYDKRYKKVLPAFDKSVQLKSANVRSATPEEAQAKTTNESSSNNPNKPGGVAPKHSPAPEKPEIHKQTLSNSKASDSDGSANLEQSQTKALPAIPPKSHITASEPINQALHSKSTSNKISSVTQQLINRINRNSNDDASQKNNMPDLISRIGLEGKGQLISDRDKAMDSVTNLESEDKILNNKVNLTQKIISTDLEQNDLLEMNTNAPESPKSPRKNSWFFGTHKNTLVFPVVIAKNPGAGFTIEGGMGTVKTSTKITDNGIYVAQVVSDGPASGALRPGDKILQANGMDFAHVPLDKAASFLNSNEPTLSLMISRK